MNDTTTTQKDIAGEADTSPQSSNGHDATDSTSERAQNDLRWPPFGWLRRSHIWFPGIWGDPF